MRALAFLAAGLLLLAPLSACVVREGSEPQPQIERKAPEPQEEGQPDEAVES